MKILVIGGTGYLGAKLVNALVDQSHEVACWVRNESSLSRLQNFIGKIELYDGGIEHLSAYLQKKKVDCIIYTACIYDKNENYKEAIEVNLILPLKILEIALESEVSKMISIGTSLPENVNIYARTKRHLSQYGELLAKKREGFSFVTVLLESFYDIDEPGSRFIPSCLHKLINNQDIELTEGLQHRDYIHMEDVLKGLSLILNSIDLGYREYSLGTGDAPTIKEIVQYLKEQTGSESVLHFGAVKSRRHEPDCCADLHELKKLGFSIQYPWKLGFEKLVKEYIKTNGKEEKI